LFERDRAGGIVDDNVSGNVRTNPDVRTGNPVERPDSTYSTVGEREEGDRP